MRRLSLLLLGMAAAACGRASGGATPPPAEFLVATADSTFWVRVDSGRVRLRAAPLRLAQVGDRFVELYVADDDRSFEDAVFVSQKVYARDLVSGDSVVIWRDTLVLSMAVAWGRAHPRSVPLGPDDEESDHPARRATVDVGLLGVHGRWLSIRAHHDVELAVPTLTHRTDRATVDVGTGRGATLRSLVGDLQATRVLRDGGRQLALARDSAGPLPTGQRQRALDALGLLELSDRRFALTTQAGQPAAELLASSAGLTEDDPSLVLHAMPTPGASWWTAAERVRYPDTVATSPEGVPVASWRRTRYALVARLGTVDGPVTLALKDSLQHEFPLLTVRGPVAAVTWLDQPTPDAVTPDAVTRAALVRAFADAAYYSDEVRTARWGRRLGRPPLRSAHDRLKPPAQTGPRLASRDVAPHDADRREQPRPRLRRRDSLDDRHHRGDLGHAARPRDVRHGEH